MGKWWDCREVKAISDEKQKMRNCGPNNHHHAKTTPFRSEQLWDKQNHHNKKAALWINPNYFSDVVLLWTVSRFLHKSCNLQTKSLPHCLFFQPPLLNHRKCGSVWQNQKTKACLAHPLIILLSKTRFAAHEPPVRVCQRAQGLHTPSSCLLTFYYLYCNYKATIVGLMESVMFTGKCDLEFLFWP